MQAKERSYETMVSFGKQGLSIAATAAVSAAVKASYFYTLLTYFFKSVLYDFYLYHLLKKQELLFFSDPSVGFFVNGNMSYQSSPGFTDIFSQFYKYICVL